MSPHWWALRRMVLQVPLISACNAAQHMGRACTASHCFASNCTHVAAVPHHLPPRAPGSGQHATPSDKPPRWCTSGSHHTAQFSVEIRTETSGDAGGQNMGDRSYICVPRHARCAAARAGGRAARRVAARPGPAYTHTPGLVGRTLHGD